MAWHPLSPRPAPGSTAPLQGPWHLPPLGFLSGPNPAQKHSLQSPSHSRIWPLLSKDTQSPSRDKARGGDRATLPTVGTGPGCSCCLPATAVSFLCIRRGCSWPAMRKGHGFSFGFIFIGFRQRGAQSRPPQGDSHAQCQPHAVPSPTPRGMLQTLIPSPASLLCPGAPAGVAG